MHTDGKIAQKEQGKKDGWKMAPSSFFMVLLCLRATEGERKRGKIKEAGRRRETTTMTD